jgi:outer membrane protein assembly factor BamB
VKAILWGLGLVAAVGCSATPMRVRVLSTDWEDDGGVSIGRVWQRIGGSPVPDAPDLVIGVAAQSDTIVGVPLGGGPRWTFSHALDARPVIAGRVVVGAGGGESFALDALSGQPLWRRATPGLALLGAGDDGNVTVVAYGAGGGLGSVLLAFRHDGELVRRIDSQHAVGVPAVLAGIAFVPWAGEYVSAIDVATGAEFGRVTLRSETSRAWVEGGALWFGELAFTRFDERIRAASKGRASTIALAVRDLPGAPRLMQPGTQAQPVLANAEDKVRLYARAAAAQGDGVSIEDGRYYATYFRIAMAFEANGGKLSWVHLNPTDIVGGATAPGSVVFCDAQGTVAVLDAATGVRRSELQLGEPIRSCAVSVDSTPPRTAEADSKALPQSPVTSLVEQLEEAVRVDDPMLVSAQRFLLRELVTVEDPSATKTLVDLASDPRTSPDLLADARSAIAKRRTGATFMEEALARHYDYLKDVLRPPPVGPIAHALGAMKDIEAAPLLASHLLDPADTEDDTMEAAAALAVVGGPAQAAAMRQFFGMYRASADDDDMAAAVASVGQALLSLHDEEGRAVVDAAIGDSMTAPYARDRLEQIRAAEEQPPQPHAAHVPGSDATPSTMPSSSSRAERQHSLPGGNVLQASGLKR